MTAYAAVINFGGTQYKPDPFPQNSGAFAGNLNYMAPDIVESFSLSPSSGHILGSPVTITATGVGTHWTGSNPFIISGGTASASMTGYSNPGPNPISAQFNLTLTTQGTVNIHDSDSGTTKTYTSAAVVPTKPLNVAALAGDASATVTFTAPADNGGATITGYTVTSSPAGGTDTNAGQTTLTHNITGLTNGTAYTFTVTATNSAGTGPSSDPSNSVTPEAVSYSIVPTGGHTLGIVNIVATGNGTHWTGSNPFVITGGGGFASLGNYHNTDFTHSTFDLNIHSNGGLVTIHDNTISFDQTYNAVAVVPSAPIIGTLTNNGNGTMTITFTPPVDDGGASVTSYTATSSAGGASNTGSSSPITINIVTFGVSQTVHVTATNSAGAGSASAESNAINPPATFTLSPSSTQTTGVKHITATGFGTTWSVSNPFSILSGPATTLTNYVNVSSTSATFDMTVTALIGGPVVIHDSNSNSNRAFPVVSATPPVLYWYQLDTGVYVPVYNQQLDATVRQLCAGNSVTPPTALPAGLGTGTLVLDWAYEIDFCIRELCVILSVAPPVQLVIDQNTGEYLSDYAHSRDTVVRNLCAV